MNVDRVLWKRLCAMIPAPVSIVDVDGRQLASNREYATFLGFDPDEVEGLDVARITRPQDRAWTRDYIGRLVRGEIDEFATEKVYVRKDGSEVRGRLHTRAVRDAHGVTSHLIGTIWPVDEESAPDESRVRRLLQFTSEALAIVAADGTVLGVTGQQVEVLGYPAPFWTDRNIGDVVPAAERVRMLDLRDQLLAAPGVELEFEIEVVGADGALQTLHIRAVNLLDDPAIGGIVLAARNVTEYRRTVAELARRRDTAEAVADARTRLLATVSHELRNPLHAVRGIAELLASEDLPPRAADLARSLVRQLSGLAHVTQDLLEAARLDAGEVTIEPVPTDLGALVDDVIALGRSTVGSRQIHVSCRVMHGVPLWVTADDARLRQVLGNLVDNAVKFTEAGSVQVVVRPDAGDVVTISVIDTGVGIPSEEQQSVLAPFTVGSTAGDRRGAGLGLSIVQRLVAAMGGGIAMTSGPGAGTRFDVSLPLPRAAPPTDAERASLPPGLTALVVEDDPVNQQLAGTQLERLGVAAVIVGRGEDAIALLSDPQAPSFDVVLMDQQLPGISGIETVQRIRHLGGDVATLPVIGVSAAASRSDRDAFIAGGMDEFVSKPASLDDLAEAIGSVIRHVRPMPGGPRDPAPISSAASPIDADVLDGLAVELGEMSIVRELVGTFLDELAARVAAIMDSGDDDARRRAAHTLKSSARLLGAGPLADACEAAGGPEPVDVAEIAAAARLAFEHWLATQP